MKKDLPKIYKNNIEKRFTNNTTVFYGHEKREKEINIDDYFKKNKAYKKEVKIILNDKEIIKKIIGRSTNYLITDDSELIKISDIKKIEEI